MGHCRCSGRSKTVADRAVEQLAEAAIEPEVDALRVAEVRIGEECHIRVLLEKRVEGIDEAAGRVGQVVAIVGGDVEHHVVTERMLDAELEDLGLAEVHVLTVGKACPRRQYRC